MSAILRTLVVCAVLLPLAAVADTPLANPGFEEGAAGAEPPGWKIPTAAREGCAIAVSEENAKSGKRCVSIGRAGGADAAGFCNLMQSLAADDFRGKRVKLRAAVRVESGRAQLWFRVDRPDRKRAFFDNMDDRPIQKPAWDYYEIIGDVHPDAEKVNIGLIVFGAGKAWLDEVTLEVVGPADPAALAGGPRNLDFETTAGGSRPEGWIRGGPDAYTLRVTQDDPKSGKKCAVLASQGQPGKDEYGVLVQSIDATPFQGKRVRLRGAVRAEVSGEHYAALWLRTDLPNGQIGVLENMRDRPIRDAAWKEYELVADVAPEVIAINFGALLVREGRLWVDDLSIEAIER